MTIEEFLSLTMNAHIAPKLFTDLKNHYSLNNVKNNISIKLVTTSIGPTDLLKIESSTVQFLLIEKRNTLNIQYYLMDIKSFLELYTSIEEFFENIDNIVYDLKNTPGICYAVIDNDNYVEYSYSHNIKKHRIYSAVDIVEICNILIQFINSKLFDIDDIDVIRIKNSIDNIKNGIILIYDKYSINEIAFKYDWNSEMECYTIITKTKNNKIILKLAHTTKNYVRHAMSSDYIFKSLQLSYTTYERLGLE